MTQLPQSENQKRNIHRSVGIIIIIIILAWAIYIYGNIRQVDIRLNTIVQIPPAQNIDQIDLTLYDNEKSPALHLTLNPTPKQNIKTHKIELKPGKYDTHIIVSFPDKNNTFIQKTLNVPEHNATIDLYIRP